MNSASQDQREEAEAMVLAFSDGVVKDTKSYANWTKNEASNLLNDGQAVIYTLANMDQGAKDFADAVSAPFEQDAAARARIAKYADTQPLLWERESAELDAKIFNGGMEIVADTVVGGAATKLVTSGGKVVELTKKGAALLNLAKATEVVDETGKLAKGVRAVKDTKKALDVGLSGEEAAALSGGERAEERRGRDARAVLRLRQRLQAAQRRRRARGDARRQGGDPGGRRGRLRQAPSAARSSWPRCSSPPPSCASPARSPSWR